MENQKNLFLAIIISMAIIFGFQLLVPQPERTPMTEEQTNDESLVDLSIQKSSSTILADRGDVIIQSGRVNFDNSKIKGPIENKIYRSKNSTPFTPLSTIRERPPVCLVM